MIRMPSYVFKSISTARLFGAGIFLLCFSFLLSVCIPLSYSDPLHLPCPHTWEWWRTTEYAAQPSAPDVVLLGSSLIQIPAFSAEADFLNQTLDVATYSRSCYLE